MAIRTLYIGASGGFDSVTLETTPAVEPGPGEITVRLRASSLNYHDLGVVSGGDGPEGASQHPDVRRCGRGDRRGRGCAGVRRGRPRGQHVLPGLARWRAAGRRFCAHARRRHRRLCARAGDRARDLVHPCPTWIEPRRDRHPDYGRPAQPKTALWAFLILPEAASAKLPTRSQVTVEGTFASAPFQATLEPDGQGSHWLKVDKALIEAAGVQPGDTVALEFAPLAKEPEPKVPPDLRDALAAHPAAKATWDDITPVARRDWIQWMTSGKKAETRVKRIATACDQLASGKRRACCFDRSGMYSRGNLGPPEAAD